MICQHHSKIDDGASQANCIVSDNYSADKLLEQLDDKHTQDILQGLGEIEKMLTKKDMKTTAVTKLLKQIKVQDDFNNWVFELTWGIISRHDQKQ